MSQKALRLPAVQSLALDRRALAVMLGAFGFASGLWLFDGPTNGLVLGLALCQGLALLLSPGFSGGGAAPGRLPFHRDPLFHSLLAFGWSMGCWRIAIRAGTWLVRPDWFLSQASPGAFFTTAAACLLTLGSIPGWYKLRPGRAAQPWISGAGIALLAAFTFLHCEASAAVGAGMLVFGSALLLTLRQVTRSWLGFAVAVGVSGAAVSLPAWLALGNAATGSPATPAWLVLLAGAGLAAASAELLGRQPARGTLALCGAIWAGLLACVGWLLTQPEGAALAVTVPWLAGVLAGALLLIRRERLTGILPELARSTAIVYFVSLTAMALELWA